MPWRKELITTKAHDFPRIPVDSICKYFLPSLCSRISITGINTIKPEKEKRKQKGKIPLLFKRFLSISLDFLWDNVCYVYFPVVLQFHSSFVIYYLLLTSSFSPKYKCFACANDFCYFILLLLGVFLIIIILLIFYLIG
jgi:hypothetical protein